MKTLQIKDSLMPTNPPNYGLTKMIALQSYEIDW